jgi:hypothetical protein
MGLQKNRIRDRRPRDELPDRLPDIELYHGRAIWVLAKLGFRGAASESTFKEYIKSLRKLGVPFEREEIRRKRRGRLKRYSYHHLMELALVLYLRVYHVVPDSVLVKIIRYRKSLYWLYRQAYIERCTGRGTPIVVKTRHRAPIKMRGVFLDLQMNFSGGKLARFGPPRSLSPSEAVATFAGRDLAARAFLPLNLSLLSEGVIALSLRAPLIRRGPRSVSRNKGSRGSR